jgi:hypothetical protein
VKWNYLRRPGGQLPRLPRGPPLRFSGKAPTGVEASSWSDDCENRKNTSSKRTSSGVCAACAGCDQQQEPHFVLTVTTCAGISLRTWSGTVKVKHGKKKNHSLRVVRKRIDFCFFFHLGYSTVVRDPEFHTRKSGVVKNGTGIPRNSAPIHECYIL